MGLNSYRDTLSQSREAEKRRMNIMNYGYGESPCPYIVIESKPLFTTGKKRFFYVEK